MKPASNLTRHTRWKTRGRLYCMERMAHDLQTW